MLFIVITWIIGNSIGLFLSLIALWLTYWDLYELKKEDPDDRARRISAKIAVRREVVALSYHVGNLVLGIGVAFAIPEIVAQGRVIITTLAYLMAFSTFMYLIDRTRILRGS